jgi:hypothetical protein
MAIDQAATNVQIAIENISAKIAELSANPKPSYQIDGQRVEHTEFFRMLCQQLEELRRIQMKLQGPIIKSSRGISY